MQRKLPQVKKTTYDFSQVGFGRRRVRGLATVPYLFSTTVKAPAFELVDRLALAPSADTRRGCQITDPWTALLRWSCNETGKNG